MTYFSPFRFDADQGTLWRGPERVRLTPKAAALLKCLLSGRGAWISKPAIMAAVWPDTHVQPDNIKVLVREIRRALGDSPVLPTFIRTAPGRGYAFVAPVSDRTDVEPARRTPAAILVGRAQELSTLAAARASSRVVFLAGEHGVGKRALVDGFLRFARAAGPVRSCHGQCFEHESPVEPYYPLLDALLRLDRQCRGLVPAVLSRHAPSWLPHFPQWLGLRSAPMRGVSALDELVAALAALSREIPLVLVLEELQWADIGTLQALTHIAASPQESSLLVVATYSDGEWMAGRRARNRVLSLHTRTATIEVGPLSSDDVAAYLDARFGAGRVRDVAGAVHHASGGNPYMMRIACDSLIARGLFAETRDGWRAAAPLDVIAHALPETLAEAVALQLDHLEPREREALEAAAVVGRSFTVSQVAVALGAGFDETRSLLALLARRGQLIAAARAVDSAPASGGRYRFRHPLYADLIARHAPMIRQQRMAERVGLTRLHDRQRA